ncbi:hypothetical protein AMECASPLE_025096 [Ameca splendens]|uniref:Uncharacterized protein n=1 Tax=Ameca splendens TaxID=208324 RepID=A0ABV0ZDG4_9TELE
MILIFKKKLATDCQNGFRYNSNDEPLPTKREAADVHPGIKRQNANWWKTQDGMKETDTGVLRKVSNGKLKQTDCKALFLDLLVLLCAQLCNILSFVCHLPCYDHKF